MTLTQNMAAISILLTVILVGVFIHNDIKKIAPTSCTVNYYTTIDGATVTIEGKGVEGSSMMATSSVKCQ